MSSNQKSGPDEAKLKSLLEEKKLKSEITVGQRRLGPPIDWNDAPPPLANEVYVGKIPKDIFEDDIHSLFEKCGKIYEIRIMLDPRNKVGRGFCFVTFVEQTAALDAVKKFHNYEIRPGKRLEVKPSTPNLRLFIGNIPKSKDKEQIKEEFSHLVEGVIDVIIYGVADDSNKKNRGFCFLEFETHAKASTARRKLLRNPKAFSADIMVSWADPQDEPDPETMQKVKVLYVKNLTSDVTENLLTEKFQPFGSLERVKKLKDYGFVHFGDRESAEKALTALNGMEIGKNQVEVTWAKPVSERRKQRKEQRKIQKQFNAFPPFGPKYTWQQTPFLVNDNNSPLLSSSLGHFNKPDGPAFQPSNTPSYLFNPAHSFNAPMLGALRGRGGSFRPFRGPNGFPNPRRSFRNHPFNQGFMFGAGGFRPDAFPGNPNYLGFIGNQYIENFHTPNAAGDHPDFGYDNSFGGMRGFSGRAARGGRRGGVMRSNYNDRGRRIRGASASSNVSDQRQQQRGNNRGFGGPAFRWRDDNTVQRRFHNEQIRPMLN